MRREQIGEIARGFFWAQVYRLCYRRREGTKERRKEGVSDTSVCWVLMSSLAQGGERDGKGRGGAGRVESERGMNEGCDLHTKIRRDGRRLFFSYFYPAWTRRLGIPETLSF